MASAEGGSPERGPLTGSRGANGKSQKMSQPEGDARCAGLPHGDCLLGSWMAPQAFTHCRAGQVRRRGDGGIRRSVSQLRCRRRRPKADVTMRARALSEDSGVMGWGAEVPPRRHPFAPGSGSAPAAWRWRLGGQGWWGRRRLAVRALRRGHADVASSVVCTGGGETEFAGRKLSLKETNF